MRQGTSGGIVEKSLKKCLEKNGGIFRGGGVFQVSKEQGVGGGNRFVSGKTGAGNEDRGLKK
jgi:hypothetical protein